MAKDSVSDTIVKTKRSIGIKRPAGAATTISKPNEEKSTRQVSPDVKSSKNVETEIPKKPRSSILGAFDDDE